MQKTDLIVLKYRYRIKNPSCSIRYRYWVPYLVEPGDVAEPDLLVALPPQAEDPVQLVGTVPGVARRCD
jgi:hypothetical protein